MDTDFGRMTPRAARYRLLALGARRRVRALSRIRHSHADVAADSGLSIKTIEQLASDFYGAGIHQRTFDAIAATYERLRHVPGTSENSRVHALFAGYPPPSAWAASTIDDPHAPPNLPQRGLTA